MSSRFGKGLAPMTTTSGPIKHAQDAAEDPVENKQRVRDKIAADVQAFLEKGGCVQAIPDGYGVLDFGAGRKHLRIVRHGK